MAHETFTILVVDDERSNLDILNKILGDEHAITVAKTGKAAISRAISDLPDLILLDVVLPDMLGFEVLKALKDSDITRKIPVIFITGLTNPEGEERGFSLGAVDYITKPFNNALVKARVRTHLQILTQMRIIEKLGMIDPLTGLPNRRSFDERLKSEWARSVREKTPLSILIMDVDHFKQFNDQYGHPLGDVLLRNIGQVFDNELKRTSDFIARIGGEEFAAILPNTVRENALEVAEAIRQSVEAMTFSEAELKGASVTISIGLTGTVPTCDSQSMEAVKKADALLYQAKKAGRNRVFSDAPPRDMATGGSPHDASMLDQIESQLPA